MLEGNDSGRGSRSGSGSGSGGGSCSGQHDADGRRRSVRDDSLSPLLGNLQQRGRDCVDPLSGVEIDGEGLTQAHPGGGPPLSHSNMDAKGRPIESMPLPKFMYLLTPFIAIGGLLFGYDTGVISGALLKIKDDFDLDAVQQELVVAITVAFAIPGAAAAGFFADRLGRRPTILCSDVVFTVGAFVMAFANGLETLLVGRALVGLGIGVASMVVPMYMAEVAPTEYRGTLVLVSVMFITGGQFIAGVVDGILSHVDSGWRYMLGFAALPSILQFIGFSTCLPESPRWYVFKHRTDEARDVLRKIRRPAAPSSNATVHQLQQYQAFDLEKRVAEELKDVMDAATAEAEHLNSWQVLFEPTLRKQLFLGCFLQAMQQLAGINNVMYYSGTIIRSAGFTANDAIWLAAIVAFFNFAFTIVGFVLVERSGRRKLTLWSLVGVTLALVFMGFVFYVRDARSPTSLPYKGPLSATLLPPDATVRLSDHDTGASLSHCQSFKRCSTCVIDSGCGFFGNSDHGFCLPGNDSSVSVSVHTPPGESPMKWKFASCLGEGATGWLAVTGLALYLMAFAPGMGPMPWTVNAEIFPLYARAGAVSVATMVNWCGNLLVSMTFLSLQNAITSYGAFWLSAGIAFLGLVVLWFILPETKGLSMEEIQGLFRSRTAVHR